MELTPAEKMDLTRHEEILAHLLEWADEELRKHPTAELCPRQAELLQRLHHAFADMQCPTAARLLSAGLADDDWRAPRAVEYINATDETPRDNWQALSPQLLRACEDGLFFLDGPAFRYVLPAYLRQYLLRPDYMCKDSIFFLLDYNHSGEKLLPLTPDQRSVVQDVLLEFRCREQQINGDVSDTLLPWEYERCRSENPDISPWTYAGNLAMEYAERHNIPY